MPSLKIITEEAVQKFRENFKHSLYCENEKPEVCRCGIDAMERLLISEIKTAVTGAREETEVEKWSDKKLGEGILFQDGFNSALSEVEARWDRFISDNENK